MCRMEQRLGEWTSRCWQPAMTALDQAWGTLSLLTLVLGGSGTWYLLPGNQTYQRWCANWPARLALAHLAGSALMAWTSTTIAVASGRVLVFPVYCIFGVLGALCWKKRQAQHPVDGHAPSALVGDATPSGLRLWIAFAAFAVFFGAVSTGLGLFSDRTLSIDAYTMWALKSKAIFLAGSFAPLVAGCCGKANYPMLFPLQAWWVYQHLGQISDWWDQLTGFLFYLDLLAITFAACRAAMPAAWAWTATAIVANNYVHALLDTKGHADSALTAYFLASSIFLMGYLSRGEGEARFPALLMLLGALQTKNEGFSWAFFAIGLMLVFETRWRAYRRAAFTGALYLLALAPWTVFKLRNHLPFGNYEPRATGQVLHAEWASRLALIAHTYFAEVGPASLAFLLLLCLPVILARWRNISKPLLTLIGAQFFSYVAVFFVMADPLWGMSGFMARGLSHLSPALICVSLIGYHAHAGRAPWEH